MRQPARGEILKGKIRRGKQVENSPSELKSKLGYRPPQYC